MSMVQSPQFFGEVPPILPKPKISRWPALADWLVIIGCLAYISYRNNHSAQLKSVTEEVGQMQLKLGVQMNMARKSLAEKTGRKLPESDRASDRMFSSMEQKAQSSEDKLRLAIFAGEAQGEAAALNKLDQLSKSSPPAEQMADITTLRMLYTQGVAAVSEQDREGLVKRLGYFGNLALAYGVPENTEPRKSLEAEAQHKLIQVGLVGLGAMVLVVASLVLFVIVIVQLVKKKFSHAYLAMPSTHSVYLEGFALYLVLYLLLGLIIRQFGSVSLPWYLPALLIIPLIMFWARWRGATADEQRRAFGWHLGQGLSQEIGAGLFGYIAGLPIFFAGAVLSAILVHVTHVQPYASPIDDMTKGHAGQILALYVLVCGFAPLMEETMFRGVLFHHLRGRWGWLASAGITAFIFGAIHPYGWVAIPALGSLAMVFAALREWRGSIIASMTAHACHNFLATTLLLMLLR